MSTSSPFSSSQPSKPERVLACVRCQHKKVKCDRKFPCANCNSSGTQCVPATLTLRGKRKRRFPERELLERLRKYEELLHQNNIKFEPLHKHTTRETGPVNLQEGGDLNDDQLGGMREDRPSPLTTVSSDRVYEAKDFWNAINPDDSDSSQEALREVITKKGWVELNGHNDHLLFSSPDTNIDLSTLHPEPVQIFRLWQIYLDNVNPLLKVTHTPSLQGRIIEAASDVTNISPSLEALVFSIYCMAISSTGEGDCETLFGSSKGDLLARFRFGCQQALLNCGFLRSSDCDCLVALYLYLLSVRPNTVPESLSAMLGVAIRIAQRMGIHSESILAKWSPLEAEQGRRLWWSLVLFDSRISETAGHKAATLDPTWDCRIPLNVNDSDLRPEMKELPMAQEKHTDALFAVVRSELADFIRHTAFYLDFTNPALKPIVKTTQHGGVSESAELVAFEKMIQDKYFQFCDLENPLHFLTIWWTRAYLAKCRFLEHHSRCFSPTLGQTDMQRDAAISHAIRMLECDTMLRVSPLTQRFLWLVHLYFPFPAYIRIAQDLKRRPMSEQAEQAWEAMSDNFEARFVLFCEDRKNPFFDMFAKLILQAWEAGETARNQSAKKIILPRIVLSVRQRMAQVVQATRISDTQQNFDAIDTAANFLVSVPTAGRESMLYILGEQSGFGLDMPEQALNIETNSPDWTFMDWGFGGVYQGG